MVNFYSCHTVKYTKLLADGTSKQNKPHLAYRFPRNTSNLQTWFELMDEHVFVEGILYLTCSEDAMMVRISRIHHIISSHHHQSVTTTTPYPIPYWYWSHCSQYRILERGKTSGRADDNKEALRKRFRTYRSFMHFEFCVGVLV